jgi:hypothetical protein
MGEARRRAEVLMGARYVNGVRFSGPRLSKSEVRKVLTDDAKRRGRKRGMGR